MASSLAQTITTNFLNCAICFETYRDPRALPCQHSFCRECLEQCVRSSEDKCTLVCPTCRKVVKISKEGVKDLPVHFLVSSLKDTVDMEQEVNICFFAYDTYTSLLVDFHDYISPIYVFYFSLLYIIFEVTYEQELVGL